MVAALMAPSTELRSLVAVGFSVCVARQALTIDAEPSKLSARGELDHCGHGRAA
jgi:hypothetical protein